MKTHMKVAASVMAAVVGAAYFFIYHEWFGATVVFDMWKFEIRDMWYDELCDPMSPQFRTRNIEALNQKTGRDYWHGPPWSGMGVYAILFAMFKFLLFMATAATHPMPNRSQWEHDGGDAHDELPETLERLDRPLNPPVRLNLATLERAQTAYEAAVQKNDEFDADRVRKAESFVFAAHDFWMAHANSLESFHPCEWFDDAAGNLAPSWRRDLGRVFEYVHRTSSRPKRITFVGTIPYYTTEVACCVMIAGSAQLGFELVSKLLFAGTNKLLLPELIDRLAKQCSDDDDDCNEKARLRGIYILQKMPFSLPMVLALVRIFYTHARTMSLYRGYPPTPVRIVMGLVVSIWLVYDFFYSNLIVTGCGLVGMWMVSKVPLVMSVFFCGWWGARYLRLLVTGLVFISSALSVTHSFEHTWMQSQAKEDHIIDVLQLEDTYVCTFMHTRIWDFSKGVSFMDFIHNQSETFVGFLFLFLAFAGTSIVASMVYKCVKYASGAERVVHAIYPPPRMLISWFQNPEYFNVGLEGSFWPCCQVSSGASKCIFGEVVGSDWWKYSFGLLPDYQTKEIEDRLQYTFDGSLESCFAKLCPCCVDLQLCCLGFDMRGDSCSVLCALVGFGCLTAILLFSAAPISASTGSSLNTTTSVPSAAFLVGGRLP